MEDRIGTGERDISLGFDASLAITIGSGRAIEEGEAVAAGLTIGGGSSLEAIGVGRSKASQRRSVLGRATGWAIAALFGLRVVGLRVALVSVGAPQARIGAGEAELIGRSATLVSVNSGRTTVSTVAIEGLTVGTLGAAGKRRTLVLTGRDGGFDRALVSGAALRGVDPSSKGMTPRSEFTTLVVSNERTLLARLLLDNVRSGSIGKV
jgi:hypothetical protein